MKVHGLLHPEWAVFKDVWMDFMDEMDVSKTNDDDDDLIDQCQSGTTHVLIVCLERLKNAGFFLWNCSISGKVGGFRYLKEGRKPW